MGQPWSNFYYYLKNEHFDVRPPIGLNKQGENAKFLKARMQNCNFSNCKGMIVKILVNKVFPKSQNS